MIFFMTKRGHDVISHVIKECMLLFVFKVPFLSLIGKCLLFLSTILHTVLSLSNYYSIFKAETNENRARSLKVVIMIVIIIIIIMIIIILHNLMM